MIPTVRYKGIRIITNNSINTGEVFGTITLQVVVGFLVELQ